MPLIFSVLMKPVPLLSKILKIHLNISSGAFSLLTFSVARTTSLNPMNRLLQPPTERISILYRARQFFLKILTMVRLHCSNIKKDTFRPGKQLEYLVSKQACFLMIDVALHAHVDQCLPDEVIRILSL